MSRLPRLLVSLLPLFALACGAPADEVDSERAGASSSAVDQARAARPQPASTRLRVVASNLTSGNGQSYDPGEGARILQGLEPDVTLIQEFNYGNNTDEELRGFVDVTFGSGFFYSRETGAQIPNGVVSRYPILESGAWTDPQVSNRKFAWARIDVPGDKDLWAISVHLLTSSSSRRQAEASELVARMWDPLESTCRHASLSIL